MTKFYVLLGILWFQASARERVVLKKSMATNEFPLLDLITEEAYDSMNKTFSRTNCIQEPQTARWRVSALLSHNHVFDT